MSPRIRRIALIEPLGDTGIGTYTYELAEALVGFGIEVDVYTPARATASSWQRRHGFYPVLGSALVRQRSQLALAVRGTPHMATPPGAFDVESDGQPPAKRVPRILKWRVIRDTYMSLELVGWLRLSGYDLVWTQWPEMARPVVSFWRAARLTGLRVVHTAHNVFPHERRAGDYLEFRKVYDNARLIITHSDMAARTLGEAFPAAASKIVTSRLGLYTRYLRRPQAREAIRKELAVPAESSIVLAYGSVRPYKNLDILIDAMAVDAGKSFTLVVAGNEFGYPNLDPNDPLALTRKRVAAMGLGDHVRLLPGPADNDRTSDLFEAADVVALPYAESYGSGVLLLAMSFGRSLVATRTGGMEEYLAVYRDGVLVEPDVSADDLLAALHLARERAKTQSGEAPRPRDLEWARIIQKLLPYLERAADR